MYTDSASINIKMKLTKKKKTKLKPIFHDCRVGINPRTYTQIHTPPPVVQACVCVNGGGGGGGA